MRIYIFAFIAIALSLIIFSCGGGDYAENENLAFSDYALPPDPGSAGKATLEGIDSNNNGVRDDVEIAIYKYAPTSEQEPLRKALEQEAKALQAAILAGSSGNSREIEKARRLIDKASDCIFVKLGADGVYRPKINIEAKAVNTDKRAEAYFRFNQALSGGAYSNKESAIPCEYDEEKERELSAAFGRKTLGEINPNLPPDPRKEGRATLEGIDSDDDGVRDDVQRAIWEYAPRADQKALRLAMMQLAKVQQEKIILSSSEDIDKKFEVYKKEQLARYCLEEKSISGTSDELVMLWRTVRNTDERYSADRRFNEDVNKFILERGKGVTIFSYEPAAQAIRCDF
jgi:hypothetical protein